MAKEYAVKWNKSANMRIGATYLGNDRCEFTVWAPLLQDVAVQITAPKPQLIPLKKEARGYWKVIAENIAPGSLYTYQLEGSTNRPDPASYYQPQGVHEPSQVVDQGSFSWSDSGWKSIPLEDYIIYEVHVGTFTEKGTFEAIIDRLDDLKELGVNAIEIMPVAQFPGDRNWGYDGVYPFAVQDSYGGVDGLKTLVDACHQKGFAVVLDVVYNHFGPEGNYTSNFAPYFIDKYRTPWGSALNFDDAYSDGVRNFFIENALYWFRDHHIDALRLDAIHAIYDFSAKHFLAELAEKVGELSQQQGRSFYLIAESDLNDVRIINPPEKGGYNIDAQWCDDFHHSLHSLITKEDRGYYRDFREFRTLVKALQEGFAYAGEYSEFRQRYHGNPAGDLDPAQFVVCCQNHDQVGNRMLGERLSQLVSFEAVKLAAGMVLLSPYIPLLFMGEEYGEEAPFLYFISHGDRDLVESVRQGRKAEFKEFHEVGEPPDAQDSQTFEQSKLNWEKRREGKHKVLFELYRTLIKLRQEVPALKCRDRQSIDINSFEGEKVITLRRRMDNSQVLAIFNFSDRTQTTQLVLPEGNWKKVLDSSDSQWMGNGSTLPQQVDGKLTLTLPHQSFVLYQVE
ncbi:MAG: malto-oligosyltrehalose trehalohydrolase [Geitlerinemataceae cyanobacterium]